MNELLHFHMDTLGNQMKAFEEQEINRKFIPGLPVYARLDGRAFHTLTAKLDKPYDTEFLQCMEFTTHTLLTELQADLAYYQSDEISLVWLNGLQEFNGKKHKLISVSASLASSAFFSCAYNKPRMFKECLSKLPQFDCRAINMPIKGVLDMLRWRELDAAKNAVNMLAHHHFTTKQLHKLNTKQRQELLFTEKGINFNDQPVHLKRGNYLAMRTQEVTLSAEEIQDRKKKNPKWHIDGTSYSRKVVTPIHPSKLTHTLTDDEMYKELFM